jgi:hypothetical protein
MSRVKRILLRRSSTLNMFFMLESTAVPLGGLAMGPGGA